MIGAILQFEFEQGLDEAKIRQIATHARSRFEGKPGLRSKAFTYDSERREAINFYVWETEEAAREFYSQAFVDLVAGVYGVTPRIRYVQIAELVENRPASGT